VAATHGYTFAENERQLLQLVADGTLVPVPGNGDYVLKPGLRFPYARPEVKHLLERLGGAYRAGCGEPLVITSLTRPKNRQPRNASPLSVHPAGMAVDLRVSSRDRCRRKLEGMLLLLEREGVLEAARERRPPHYHVALFPSSYIAYLATQGITEATPALYRVRPGDTLWSIARRHGLTVPQLREANGIHSNLLRIGQELAIPAY
jgi:hypothetical protein